MISLVQTESDNRLETRLDNQEYDESQLIEIQVALNMPYQERFTDFERHYGEIEIDGRSYTYVKRKIDGNTVIFKCIANESKQQLRSIQDELAQANSNTDMDQPGQQKQTSFAKNLLSEYEEQTDLTSLNSPALLKKNYVTGYSCFTPAVSLNTPHQPPENPRIFS